MKIKVRRIIRDSQRLKVDSNLHIAFKCTIDP